MKSSLLSKIPKKIMDTYFEKDDKIVASNNDSYIPKINNEISESNVPLPFTNKSILSSSEEITDYFSSEPDNVDHSLIKFSDEGKNEEVSRILLDTVNITESSKIEYLRDRFQYSDWISELIKRAYVENDTLRGFLNSYHTGPLLIMDNKTNAHGFFTEISTDSKNKSEYWTDISNESNVSLLNEVYILIRRVVIYPNEMFDSERLFQLVQTFESNHTILSKIDTNIMNMHNDFFSLCPEVTTILKLLYATRMAYNLCSFTRFRIFENLDATHLNAREIFYHSPFRDMTAVLNPMFQDKFIRNNISVETLTLQNVSETFSTQYVSTHLFTNVFTHECLRHKYTDFLLITSRIGYSHPIYGFEVNHETEGILQYLKEYLHLESVESLNSLEWKNYELLKDSNFLGKVLFQALLNPKITSSINMMMLCKDFLPC